MPASSISYLVGQLGTRETAERLGVSQRSVQRYLKGDHRTKPTVERRANRVAGGIKSARTREARETPITLTPEEAGTSTSVGTRAAYAYEPGRRASPRWPARAPSYHTPQGITHRLTSGLGPNEELSVLVDLQRRREIVRFLRDVPPGSSASGGLYATGWMDLRGRSVFELMNLADGENNEIISTSNRNGRT